jgi:type II secretory pathway component PulF
LEAGLPLPDALQKGKLPPYYTNLVAAGVQTGRLPEVLSTLTVYARTVATTRATILEALLYPAVVFLFAVALFTLLIVFVVPQFDKIFTEFGLTLPRITWAVLLVARNPMVTLVMPGLALLGTLLSAWLVSRFTPAGRRAWARSVYAIPILGTLIRAARLAAFADLLALLVETKVPLPAAFRLAGGASSDPIMAQQAEEVCEDLAQGVPLAETFRGRGLVPEWVAWMAGAGEQRGDLAGALRQVANVYRRQVEVRASVLRSAIPQLLILLTAGIITAVFVIAVMMPMFTLLEGLAK